MAEGAILTHLDYIYASALVTHYSLNIKKNLVHNHTHIDELTVRLTNNLGSGQSDPVETGCCPSVINLFHQMMYMDMSS